MAINVKDKVFQFQRIKVVEEEISKLQDQSSVGQIVI